MKETNLFGENAKQKGVASDLLEAQQNTRQVRQIPRFNNYDDFNFMRPDAPFDRRQNENNRGGIGWDYLGGNDRQLDSDYIIFNEDQSEPSSTTRRPMMTSTVAVPGMGTTTSACETRCQTTSEYNPACGTDNMTYFNASRLRCAQQCGKRISVRHFGRCTGTPLGR